jgi:hypothetical protein
MMQVIGAKKVHQATLRRIVAKSRSIFLEQRNCSSLHHMQRRDGNPADYYVGFTKDSRAPINPDVADGFSNLFDTIPVRARRTLATIHQAAVELQQATIFDVPYTPDSFSSFTTFRRIQAHLSIPVELAAGWSSIVKRSIQQLLNAPSAEERSACFRRLMVLPNLYLPANRRTTQLERSLCAGKPFPPQSPKRFESDSCERRRKRVMRYANHGMWRKASSSLQAKDVESVLTPDETRAHLQSKFSPEPFVSKLQFAKSHVRQFSGDELRQALRRMSTAAATNIDGWTPTATVSN